MNIKEAVEVVLNDSTGRFRYRMVVAGLTFHSEPLRKERFLMEYDNLVNHADLTAIQYESKTEYTPGSFIWQTF